MVLSSNLQITAAKPDDCDEILDFLFSDFIKRDPLSVLNVPEIEARPVFKGAVEKALNRHPCFVYYIRNENDEIVALRSALERNRSEPQYMMFNKEDDKIHPVKEFNRKMMSQLNLWDHVPAGVDKVFWISLISVKEDYARQGLAKELLHFDTSDLKERHGFQAIAAIGAAMRSQKLFASIGMNVLHEVLHENIAFEENGGRILNAIDGTDRHQLLCKYL